MGKTRDLFKKIEDIKGTFHAKMGMRRDEMARSSQKQNRLRRSHKNIQKRYTKKVLMTGLTTMAC